MARLKYPETELLTAVNGVGTVTALAFRLKVGAAERFEHSREVAATLGCGRGGFNPAGRTRNWGSRKQAVVAVARKLAVLLHRLPASGEVYEPLRNSAGRGRLAAKA